MGDRDAVAVDWVAGGGEIAGSGFGFAVGDDLVAEEVEVDPDVGAAAFRAAEDDSVEVARGGEVVDRKGYVEGTESHGEMIRGGR